MASNYYEDVTVSGTTKTTTKYTCEAADMSYTIISDDIKNDFNFLKDGGELYSKIEEIEGYIKSAAGVLDPFDVNGTRSVDKMKDDILKQTTLLKSGLIALNSAFITDINNVNAELSTNFGHWAFSKVKNAGKTTETVESGNKS